MSTEGRITVKRTVEVTVTVDAEEWGKLCGGVGPNTAAVWLEDAISPAAIAEHLRDRLDDVRSARGTVTVT